MAKSSAAGDGGPAESRGASERVLTAAGQSFSVREFSDGPLGVMLFEAAEQLLASLAGLRDWAGVSVVELGAGTGALAIGLAKLGATVFATDFDIATLENLQFNVDRNEVGDRVKVLHWDWADRPPKQIQGARVQYCVGSEVAYACNAALLCGAISKLKASAPDLEVHLMLRERGGRTVHTFVECCQSAGMAVHLEPMPSLDGREDYTLVSEDPDEWGDNPAYMPGTVSLLRL